MNTYYTILAITFCLCFLMILLFMKEHLILLYYSKQKNKKTSILKDPKYFPKVSIQLPIYNEKHVVKRLLKSIFEIDYPAEKLEIQILDDSTDETTKLIQETLLLYKDSPVNYHHIQRKTREGYKAGNLANGLITATGELIAIFDADFQVPRDFLLKTVPYFENKKTAAVQTKWEYTNRDHSILTAQQAEILDSHFNVEKLGRHNAELFVQFNGTGGIWRKEAILQAGGWQDDTLIEDVDLSFRAQLKGWKIEYAKDIHCMTDLPQDLNSIKTQQFRWIQGGAESAKKHFISIWKSDFSFKKKFHASAHLLTSGIYLFIFLACILSVPLVFLIDGLNIPKPYLNYLPIGIFLIWVALFLGSLKSKQKKNKAGLVQLFIIFFNIGIALNNSIALFKGFAGIKTAFKRTPKYLITEKNSISNEINAYTEKTSIITYGELLLSIYFIFGMIISLQYNNLVLLIFHLVFAISYGTIAYLSLFPKASC